MIRIIEKIFYPSLVFILLLLLVQCDTNEPPTNSTLSLKLEDVSCTEAWIELTTTNLPLPTTITLYKNNVGQKIILSNEDTLLYIDSLVPNQTYNFKATCHSGLSGISSNNVTATTMDTTSHNFTFKTFTFGGEAGSCTFYDVAIINENYIIAVGTVFLTDSVGEPDPQAYGVAIWDGSNWELKKLFYNTNIPVTPRGIFVISSNEIYFASGSIFRWDGSSSIVQLVYSRLNLPDPNATIEKLWGSSGSSIYGVGNIGSIVFYNGTSWQRIESGTTTNINDVWGIVAPITQEKIIYCAVSFVFQTGDQKILTINNNKVDSLSWNTGRRVHSVWSNSDDYLYAAGGGIFENKQGYWNEITEVPIYYSRNIRGNDINNIFVCGDFGLFAHFNGSSWHTYSELYIQGIYFSVAVKDNTVITVGLEGSKAIIIKGTRN